VAIRQGRTHQGIPRSVRCLVRHLACAWLGGRSGASAPAPLPAPHCCCRRQRQQCPAGAQQLGCAGRSGLPSVMSGVTHTPKRLSFGTSWRATKMAVQGAQERMFCHAAPIHLPCPRSLAGCPVTSSADERVSPWPTTRRMLWNSSDKAKGAGFSERHDHESGWRTRSSAGDSAEQ
jgi:hypothetical protein